MKDLSIIYQLNEKYVPFAGVSITSLLENNKEASSITIYVLGESISPESKQKLTEAVEKYGRRVFFPNTTSLLLRFKKLGMIPYRGTYSVYLRLFFPELIPTDVERAIYLDADTIVDGSLEPLSNFDLKGKSVGMVLESITDDYKTMIGMSTSSEYYNSGMILYDVDKWKTNGYCDKIVHHAQSIRSSYIGDQDFINIVCEGDIFRLPPKYNFQPSHKRYTTKQYFTCFGSDPYYTPSEVEESSTDVAIYHCYRWLGDFPWNRDNLHPFNEVFDKYLKMSLWKDYKKEKAGFDRLIVIEKLLYRMLPKIIFIRVFKIAHEMMLYRAERDARTHMAHKNA